MIIGATACVFTRGKGKGVELGIMFVQDPPTSGEQTIITKDGELVQLYNWFQATPDKGCFTLTVEVEDES